MNKNLQIKNSLKTFLFLVLSCFTLLLSCKKNDANPIITKNATFSVNVAGTIATGTDFLEDSYITTNDEYLATPYVEIHIAGSSSSLDIMIANPTVKQYSFGVANAEAGVLLNVNGTNYEAVSTSVLNVTEATSSKISGTISGIFKNVSNSATVSITNGSFSAQF